MNHFETSPSIKLIRLKTVLEKLGIARSSFYAGVAEGRFPRPIRLTERTAAWLESEIDDLIRQKIEERG